MFTRLTEDVLIIPEEKFAVPGVIKLSRRVSKTDKISKLIPFLPTHIGIRNGQMAFFNSRRTGEYYSKHSKRHYFPISIGAINGQLSNAKLNGANRFYGKPRWFFSKAD
ncbi:MAG: hypothetical protein ABIC36_01895 [bacterium]